MARTWIYSNNSPGYDKGSDWDTLTILKTKCYYFKASESNRAKVKTGDTVFFREYGLGFWGTCEIYSEWVEDEKAKEKYQAKAGWFPMEYQ